MISSLICMALATLLLMLYPFAKLFISGIESTYLSKKGAETVLKESWTKKDEKVICKYLVTLKGLHARLSNRPGASKSTIGSVKNAISFIEERVEQRCPHLLETIEREDAEEAMEEYADEYMSVGELIGTLDLDMEHALCPSCEGDGCDKCDGYGVVFRACY